MTKEQWKAIESRDAAYDGQFYYAVKSSKSICKPSCTARKPVPENVIIFSTLEDGIKAGFHPCSRCRPDLPDWQGAKRELAARAEEYIRAHYTDKFSLDQIADALFVNKIYLSKCFKAITGDTLLHFHNKVRCEKACELLTGSELSVDVIGRKAGFATSSHFAKVFRSFYNCSPTEYKKKFLSEL